MLTPYGMRLTWELQTVVKGKKGMVFSIHLKDNRKVKNKKRWSQVMYMSYVLDFFMKELGDGGFSLTKPVAFSETLYSFYPTRSNSPFR